MEGCRQDWDAWPGLKGKDGFVYFIQDNLQGLAKKLLQSSVMEAPSGLIVKSVGSKKAGNSTMQEFL